MYQILEDIKLGHILIVDDTPKNSLLLQGILTAAGFSNINLLEGGEFVEEFVKNNPVDIILLDLNMPNFNGFDVLKMMKSQFSEKNIPIIIISAQNEPQTKIRALKVGAKDFISKPVDRFETVTRVTNTLESRQNYLKVLQNNENLEQAVMSRTAELQKTSEQLRMSHRDTLVRLANAAACRDNETGHHLTRMAKYSCLIAAALNWTEEEIEYLLFAAPMHDLGKIAIPDAILLKPGKLTDDEFEIMKTHATKGADMLKGSSSKVISMAEKIARSHHEKWDGTGYPLGLVGQDIPEVGRIVSVADCFDALTSKRPYKEPWPVEEALDYLQKYSGIWYDPTVVDAFIRVMPQVLEIKEQYKDLH